MKFASKDKVAAVCKEREREEIKKISGGTVDCEIRSLREKRGGGRSLNPVLDGRFDAEIPKPTPYISTVRARAILRAAPNSGAARGWSSSPSLSLSHSPAVFRSSIYSRTVRGRAVDPRTLFLYCAPATVPSSGERANRGYRLEISRCEMRTNHSSKAC